MRLSYGRESFDIIFLLIVSVWVINFIQVQASIYEYASILLFGERLEIGNWWWWWWFRE
jgi:hypothetical protein